MTTLPIALLRPRPDQPRSRPTDQEVQSLAADIQQRQKLLQPIRVRPVGDHYEIVAGERRYRASLLAGLTEVPVVIDEEAQDDDTAFEDAVAENVHRQDLCAIDLAISLRRIAIARGQLEGVDAGTAKAAPHLVTHKHIDLEALATQVSMPKAKVTRYLRLLVAPPPLLAAMQERRVGFSVAEELVALAKKGQLDAALKAVRAAAAVTKQAARTAATPTRPQPPEEEGPLYHQRRGAIHILPQAVPRSATAPRLEHLITELDQLRAALKERLSARRNA